MEKHQKSVGHSILTLVILIQAMVKVLFFLRLFDGLGSLVQMLITTISELTSFLMFFIVSVLFFYFAFVILAVDFDDAGDPSYPGVINAIVVFLGTYRTSIGDIQNPVYDKWSDGDYGKVEKGVIVTAIWIMWLMTSFINLIILLNFLIAVISQVYDQVIADLSFWNYKYKSDFNREYYVVMHYLNRLDDFRVLVQTQDINFEQVESKSEYFGIVKTIKNQVIETGEELRNDIIKTNVKNQFMVGQKMAILSSDSKTV